MKKSLIVCLVALLAFGGVAYAKSFPKRNITAVVVWGAGGGTDTCNRIIHAEMSKFLGVNVNVINKTGGVAGSVGMNYAFSRPHDGYTLCGLSESNVTAGVQGGWDYDDTLNLARAEIDNSLYLKHLIESTDGKLIDTSPDARGENVLRFGPDFTQQLKLKTDIMNAHWQDYKRLFETPNP